MPFCLMAKDFESQRPAPQERLFVSEAVESTIEQVCSSLENPKLSWMFRNCFPNTLDTTVHYREDKEGNPDTFVYTGDIHAMWLRDSGAQVWPYVQLCGRDPHLARMIAGVINRQFYSICIDPYANAFNDGPTGGHWMSDGTDMNPNDHERKWEIDSHCYPIRLAYEYWKVTGDTSVFGVKWIDAVHNILRVLREQQRFSGHGSYHFTRVTDRQLDTKCNNGLGNPVRPCGLIASAFRPSDDATTFEFLVPSNFFAVTSLRKAAEILREVNGEEELACECESLASEVHEALLKHAIVEHPVFGKIYAFEVDGFGNAFMMDDANVPSLLAMAYLGDVSLDDPIYQNTRRFVWSEWNPYFFKGAAAEGIGGPHIGYDMIWPMSIMMRAFTSTDDYEIADCIKMLLDTDAGTGFIHESFHKDDPSNFTRKWFAWQNTLFGELIIKLINDGKLDVLNSVKTEHRDIASESKVVRIKYNGTSRVSYLYKPQGLRKGAPVLYVLHGYGGSALNEPSRFLDLADKEGFAVCYPMGSIDPQGKCSWNVGYPFQEGSKEDDIDYLKTLVRTVSSRYGLSSKNVFLTGMSNGGEMCYLMAMESPSTFAAIASISGLTLENMPMTFSSSVPFMEVHGTMDGISLWEGDPNNQYGWGAYLPVEKAVGQVVKANGCTRVSEERVYSKNFLKEIILHKNEGGKAPVYFYEVKNGGHDWALDAFDTCSAVWSFCRENMR